MENEEYHKYIDLQEPIKVLDHQSVASPLMVGTLKSKDEIHDLVLIYDMDFEDANEYAFQLFKVILEWVNTALLESDYVNELKYPKSRLLFVPYETFQEKVQASQRRKELFGLDYAITEFRLVPDYDVNLLDQELRRLMREMDVFMLDEGDRHLSILMPGTNPSMLPHIHSRLSNKVTQFVVE